MCIARDGERERGRSEHIGTANSEGRMPFTASYSRFSKHFVYGTKQRTRWFGRSMDESTWTEYGAARAQKVKWDWC